MFGDVLPPQRSLSFTHTQVLIDHLFIPKRSSEGPFVFSVDHCFPIRGQGTVMTGTVLNGSVAISDVSETRYTTQDILVYYCRLCILWFLLLYTAQDILVYYCRLCILWICCCILLRIFLYTTVDSVYYGFVVVYYSGYSCILPCSL